MVDELRIEADAQNISGERDRMRLQQVTAGKRAYAAHGIHDLAPELFQVRVNRRGDCHERGGSEARFDWNDCGRGLRRRRTAAYAANRRWSVRRRGRGLRGRGNGNDFVAVIVTQL